MLVPDPDWLGLLLGQGWCRARRAFSSVGVRAHDVRVRNFPRWPQTFALEDVERFDWRHRDLRDDAVLVLTSGKVVEVYALGQNRPGRVADLNNSLLAKGRGLAERGGS